MSKKPKIEVEDEPGAERRFMRGIRKALKTPPKPFTPKKKDGAASKKDSKKKISDS